MTLMPHGYHALGLTTFESSWLQPGNTHKDPHTCHDHVSLDDDPVHECEIVSYIWEDVFSRSTMNVITELHPRTLVAR
jgi:hypothetical protein